LAHLLLADPDPETRVGSVAADFLKRSEYDTLSAGIRRGIAQHQRVDTVTDTHPIVQRSLRRLDDRWGWFKGILIDVYFDFVLARHWSLFSDLSLGQFLWEAYGDWKSLLDVLPAPTAASLHRIITTDRLGQFQHPTGEAVLAAYRRLTQIIEHRMPRNAMNLEPAFAELYPQDAELTADFLEFFPLLRAEVDIWNRDHPR
jgi:acyl carrier protein phosphodiesterase